MSGTFDPYHKWLGIPPKDQPPNYYRLLGLTEFTNDPAVIQSAGDRQITHLQTIPPVAEYADALRQLIQQVKAAELCLLDAGTKAAYDQQLKARRGAKSGIRKAKPLPRAKPLEESPRAAGATNIPMGAAVAPDSPIAALGAEADSDLLHRHKKKSPLLPLFITLAIASVIPLLGLVYLLVSGDSEENVAEAPAEPPPSSPQLPDAQPALQPDEAPIPAPQLPPGQTTTHDNELTTTASDSPPDNTLTDPGPTDADSATSTDEPPLGKVAPLAPDKVALPENDDRLAVPDQANQQEALEVIREVFDADLSSAATASAKRAIANQAIEATKTIDDEGAEFTLFEFAREHAVEAGDFQLALQIVDQLSERYRIDDLQMKSDTLLRAASTADSLDQRLAIVEAAKPLIAKALSAGRLQAAKQLADSAFEVAKKTGQYNLVKQILDLKKEVEAKLGAD